MRFYYFFFAIAIFACGCSWFESDNKEQYLKDYDAFVAEFSAQYSHYTPSDWQNAAETINELTTERYHQFEQQLSYREKLVLSKWAVMFALTRYKYIVRQQIRVEYSGDTETLLNGLREIMDSTYTVYDGFDADMRDLLFKIKPCD